jgi:outer membrane protein assembly factor BamD (BamD/ComL family)
MSRAYRNRFPESSHDIEVQLQTAYFDYRAGSYDTALGDVDEFLRANPTSEFCANGMLVKGLSLFAKNDFAAAGAAFDALSKMYPKSRFAGRACYMAGTSWLFAFDRSAAMSRFRRVVDFYPDEPTAESARRLTTALEAQATPAAK